MRVEIRCKRSVKDACEELLVWEGELPYVPRKGDLIEVFDGFALRIVLDVIFLLDSEEPKALLEIGPDLLGEFADEIEHRAKIQGKS